jgi:starch-binding outer membrane protein, SusD/RagB family
MKSNKFLISAALVLGLFTSCKDELDVKNPNQPTPESAKSESGIISLAQGGVYINGFRGLADKYVDGVPGYFWSGAVGLHEIMGDVIGCEAANWYLNQIGCPDEATLDNGTVLKNPQSPATQYGLLREINQNANQGSNPTFHEWANMYGLNNACNNILALVDNVTFVSGADTKKNTLKAWAYWWKGYAYSRLASIYYAGVINSEANLASSVFVSKEKLMAEATANLDKAAGLLGGLSAGGDYDQVLGKLIPSFCQVGKGGILTPAAWKRNINSLKARNILVNTPVATMTAAQWSSIASLTADGIKSGDLVFTGRSNEAGDIWSGAAGTVAAKATSATPGGNTYKISERFVQDFKAGDKRLDNNLKQDPTGKPWIGNSDRGIIFNTRYYLKDGGDGMAGVIVYSNRTAGATELYLASSFEENELMRAEAKIYSNDVEGGLAIIDAVRASQGAGLAATVGTGLSAAAAKEELRKERRCGLAFRGLSFYDARRWGICEKGQSRTGCKVITQSGANVVINVNATIKYNYLDYWDVPDNELAYNKPAAGSDPTKNPK